MFNPHTWRALAALVLTVLATATGTASAAPAFGFNEDWHARAGLAAHSAALGAEVNRQGLYWGEIERAPGQYDWARFDRVHAEFRDAGVRPLFVALGSPCWARPSTPCTNDPRFTPPDPRFNQAYARFAAAAAQRYPDMAAIELWNEPNFDTFWTTGPDPAGYSRLACSAYRAVKSAAPGLTVIAPALAPRRRSSAHIMGQASFLKGAMRAGLGACFDDLSVHLYPEPRNLFPSLRRQLDEIRRTAAAAEPRRRARRIWVTEAGIPGARAGDSQQAQLLRSAFMELRAQPGIRAMLAHRFKDAPASAPAAGPADPRYGLLDATGAPKAGTLALLRDLGVLPRS
ncbi:MAG: hypothetical protein H0V29_11510 [Thermoleophilaceae bacterium]|nr:hypothetical protein [Thermoleophilaceae bacterium]